MIAHQRRHGEIGQSDGGVLCQEIEAVVGDLRVDRCAFVLPIGDQLVECNRIEHRAGKMAGVECRDQIGFHKMSAARHVDDEAAFGHRREGLGVQDARRLSGQREQADQNVGLAEKRIQFSVSGKTLHAGQRFARAAPARNRKPQFDETQRREAADLAQAQQGDAGVLGAPRQHHLAPGMILLCGIEQALMAVPDQHLHQNVLRHLPRQGRIDEAHQRHLFGIIGIAQKSVHPGAQRKRRLQIRQGLEQAGRRAEAEGVIDALGRIGVAAVHDQPDGVQPRRPQIGPLRRHDHQQGGLAHGGTLAVLTAQFKSASA